MSRCCEIRLRIACVMCTCFITPIRCTCLMRMLPSVAICRNASTRSRQATTSLLLPCRVSVGPDGPRTTSPPPPSLSAPLSFSLSRAHSLSLTCPSELLLVFEDSDDRRPQCAAHHGVNHGEGLCCLLPSVLRVHQQPCPRSFCECAMPLQEALPSLNRTVYSGGETRHRCCLFLETLNPKP
jgi:hypothetical protein